MKKSGNLNSLLSMQYKFMVALGIDPGSGTLATTGSPSKEELEAAIGISVESAEILEILAKANRKWKSFYGPHSLVKEELIDVMFFILELSVLLGLSGDDLDMLYQAKYDKNLDRLVTSYGSLENAIAENKVLAALLKERANKGEE